MATKTEIREYAKRARESLRSMESALQRGSFDDAAGYAMQASGECGECEHLIGEYQDQHDKRGLSLVEV